MANFFILTNNAYAADKYPDLVTVMPGASVEEIFKSARDSIHKGSKLINHPLSGSIKPNESPYKSLVLSNEGGPLDVDSLQLIEGAVEVLKKLPKKERTYSERVHDDFRVIDLDLLDSAISALPSDYHY